MSRHCAETASPDRALICPEVITNRTPTMSSQLSRTSRSVTTLSVTLSSIARPSILTNLTKNAAVSAMAATTIGSVTARVGITTSVSNIVASLSITTRCLRSKNFRTILKASIVLTKNRLPRFTIRHAATSIPKQPKKTYGAA